MRRMRENGEAIRRMSRRGMILGGVQTAIVGVLAVRFRHLQIDRADNFRLLADENSIKIRLIPPARGLLQDRNGRVIAGNEQNFRVTITREDAGDVETIMHRLSRLIPMTA